MPQDETPPEQDTKTQWAERRTDWAEDRTVLANERTFAGWMRTGMAGVAIAVGLRAIFGDVGSSFYPARIAATIFILVACYVFWEARSRAAATLKRLSDHQARPIPTHNITIIAVSLIVGALATGLLLWLI